MKMQVTFEEISKKTLSGLRLTSQEGLFLFEEADPQAVYELADSVRKQKCAEIVHYATTLFIHPTNLCELSCPLCSFYAKPGWKTAWFLTPAEIEEKIKQYLHLELTEIHIVGGLWRDCNLDYYHELFDRIRRIDPSLHIKALTPVEYHFLSELHNIPINEVFQMMKGWGLGSLPGGGAEILVEEIRKKIAPQKITSDQFLEFHAIAHKEDIPSNITMLYGHLEEHGDIITHLCKVRELQDQTNGFQCFVPLLYHLENNALGKRTARIKLKNSKLVFAVSRLMLDNIRNIKVLWNYLGVDLALEILQAGGNDLASTATEEKIITMAGGIQLKMTAQEMEQLIHSINRVPQKIHSGYYQHATM